MQTHFTLVQLADKAVAESEKILRTCVHCGFCTATCPTYLLLGDERDSPRGRIYLIKDMLEQGRPATAVEATHIDRCLSCLSCMTTCPSGVHYMHLVDHARAHVARTYRRPLADRLVRALLAGTLPHRGRFRLALAGARVGRRFRTLLPASLRPMVDLAPARIHGPDAQERPGLFPAHGPKRMRVALLAGCVQPVLDPAINEAAIRLLNRLGAEVVIPAGLGCCGALAHHMGDDTHGGIAANIRALMAEMEGDGLDAVIVTASGCGTMLKDYGFLLRDDPVLAGDAARVSALARDVTEVLASLGLPEGAGTGGGLRVAYHSACSLQHGQKVTAAPRDLLRAAGFELLEVPEGHICCGSAGTYNMLQPELSAALLARKLVNVEQTAPDVIAAGNIGCITQIGSGTDIPIVHTVQLLDWATGGPSPLK